MLMIALLVLPAGGVWAETLPNDPDFQLQWYLSKIQAPLAWDMTTGSKNVTVAILDTGVDYTHPDLLDNIWNNPNETLDGVDNDSNGFADDVHGWDFIDNDPDPRPHIPPDGADPGGLIHGTLIAGIIGAVGGNNEGISGIAWHISLMPLRVLDESGEGEAPDVIRAIDYAIRSGARIINLSFVGAEPNVELDHAIRRAYEAGVLVVAAGGNDSVRHGLNLDNTILYPVCNNGGLDDRIMGVASTDGQDRKSTFSNYGSRCIDIAAPGEGIYSTQVYDSAFPKFSKPYSGFWNGSSLAAPMVSGAAALVWSARSDLSLGQVRDILYQASDSIDGRNPSFEGMLGRGRVNLAKAVALARAAPPPPTPPPSVPSLGIRPATQGMVQLKYPVGTLLKAPELAAVYYYGRDGARHPFPDERVFRSWYTNFDGVREVGQGEIGSIALGKSVGVRPGARLLQFVSLNEDGTAYVIADPSVYAVDARGEIRHILTAEVARELYTDQYELLIVPMIETAFSRYTPGPAIVTADSFNKDGLLRAPPSIDDELQARP